MSLANDHYYGYMNRYLMENSVTWLECAAASVCWSTMLVYYLEEPFGHLMKESMEGAEARTQVTGNLFSFAMSWPDVLQACKDAQAECERLASVANAYEPTSDSENRLGLPHTEETLAS